MKLLVVVLGAFLSVARASDLSVGFCQIRIPDPPGKPLSVALWYPTGAQPSIKPLGPFHQDVALNGAIAGTKLPIVFMSHGTGGSLVSHYDTALALAQAGFIVVALTHTGDNSQDQSYAGNRIDLIDRPRQLERVIGFVLDDWGGRTRIDSGRVGIFGFPSEASQLSLRLAGFQT